MKLRYKSATFNPLDFIDSDSPTAIDDCRDIAQALVVRTGQEKDPHWCDGAEIWIAGMAATTVQYGVEGNRSLQTVRHLLTSAPNMTGAVELMQKSDAWGGMLARIGHQLSQFKGDEAASTHTTLNRFMRFLDTPAMAENTESSSFNPAGLCKGNMTVYLVLPPEHMRAQSPWLRMNIGALLRAVVRGGLQETNKVHFVLDESASLGKMEAIDDALDKYRGYGVRCQFYYQSVGQLKKCFPEGQDQTLLSNTTQIFFGVNDQQTAEYVSARLGEATILLESGGSSRGGSRQVSEGHSYSFSTSTSWNENRNWNQHGRKLLKPEEVMALPPRTAITFTPGVAPIRTTLLRCFEEPWLTKRWTWFARQRDAFSVLLRSVIFLVWMCLMAYCLTELAVQLRTAEKIDKLFHQMKGGRR
jgi:type IV secretion system protein VirD4